MQLEHVEALIAPAGQDLLRQAVALRDDGQSELRIGERLRRQFPAGLVAAALAQIELRERARVKFTRAARMLFTRAGLEQASSEVVSKSTRSAISAILLYSAISPAVHEDPSRTRRPSDLRRAKSSLTPGKGRTLSR